MPLLLTCMTARQAWYIDHKMQPVANNEVHLPSHLEHNHRCICSSPMINMAMARLSGPFATATGCSPASRSCVPCAWLFALDLQQDCSGRLEQRSQRNQQAYLTPAMIACCSDVGPESSNFRCQDVQILFSPTLHTPALGLCC